MTGTTTEQLQLYTVRDAAKTLQLAPRTVRDLIANGDLTAVNVGRGKVLPAWRISASALAAYIDSRRVGRAAS